MSMNFEHVTLGQRVLFGAGKSAEHLNAEVTRLQPCSVMVIAGKRDIEVAERITAEIQVAVWHSDVVMHVPRENAEAARRIAAANRVDLVVSIGGGSTTGLAKAIALTCGITIIAVPTTYAGSEATDVWGITEASRKTTGVDARVLPETVVYDSELMLSLPVGMSVASGLNGMAHCIDSLWAPRADPINAALATEGIRALNSGLPKIVADGDDIQGRDETLYGAYLAAVSFASAGSGLHHKICHILGGMFNLPHAQTHATVLPYVLAYNGPYAPDAEARAAAAFGTATALEGLESLRERVDAPTSLADYGFTGGDIPQAVEAILQAVPVSNPREVNSENLGALLSAALTGVDPVTLSK